MATAWRSRDTNGQILDKVLRGTLDDLRERTHFATIERSTPVELDTALTGLLLIVAAITAALEEDEA